MTWTWNPWAIPDLLAFVAGIAMAGLVWVTRPDRTQNRLLAVFLFLEAFTTFWFGFGYKSASTPSAVYAAGGLGYQTWIWWMVCYLLFASTLDTPIVRPLRDRWVRGGLIVAAALTSILLRVRPGILRSGALAEPWYGGFSPPASPLTPLFFGLSLLISVFVLVAAIAALRASPRGSPRRVRAKAFVAAFACRDVGMVLFAVSALAVGGAFGLGGASVWDLMILVVYPFALLAFQTLLALGIIRTQLFDIDLKIKWTVRQGTLLAALAAIFFLIKEGLESLLPLEGVLPGLAGATAIALFVYPLWRMAGHLSNKVMPEVRDADAYRLVRKQEVYQAALEELITDGVVNAKERRTLLRLKAHLGLDDATAQRVESELMAARDAV